MSSLNIKTRESDEQLVSVLRKAMAGAELNNTRELFLELNPHLREHPEFGNRYVARKIAAVLIPIIMREEPTVLLTLRSTDTPSHAGQVSFPGGRVHDDDPDLEFTALRETHEEVGISPDKVEVLGHVGEHLGGMGYNVTPYLGLVRTQVDFVPCPREVGEIFEVPLSYVLDLKNHGTEEKFYDDVSYHMFNMPYKQYNIWGLTAGILRSFAERVDAVAK